ncbi:uncharacterized protein DUF4440 [Chitinophaga skermanii]|uniref:Uncharacterized protein DUF4440 n=1 Tax=Chitinophaga skermanii TaxID=331697 RepID=A0A327QPG2_9BACT|nr:nuclear transport factor 2 family protein [Chitinophaga skermanii]RAJ05542.1 uncharacterized protein DUF4440 [Chitinophaga skermanii]
MQNKKLLAVLPILTVSLLLLLSTTTNAQKISSAGYTITSADTENGIIALSKEKWRWMADKQVDTLNMLFNTKSVFVHMGGSWGKDRELEVIRTGSIHYKHADIQQTSVQIIDNTAIVLTQIRLLAVVGGNEVTNPFIVTEVYINNKNAWQLGSLSFTRTLGQ